MKQTFETTELKTELERALGFRLRTLKRLGGASALNFKAVRDTDGMAFAVKCSPIERQEMFDRLLEHLRALIGSKAVHRVFEQECFATFRGFNVVCTSWCRGESVFPDKLTDAQFEVFLDDHQEFSAAMQCAKTFGSPHPVDEWRETVLTKCAGFFGAPVRRIIESLPSDECRHLPELLKVTHDDYHHGNFLFENGRVSGYLDLEEFRAGYPADDLVRYFVCAAEHLRWHNQHRKRRMLRLFRKAVERLPYSRHEWMTAINARYIGKVNKKTRNQERIGFLRSVNLAWRFRFYRAMRETVERAFENRDAV